MTISGSTAIITGGASGLGAATAAWLLDRGAKVALIDLNENLGEDKAKELGKSARFYKADVSSEAEVRMAIEAVVQDLGSPRITVNCAGVVSGSKTLGKTDGVYGPHPYALFEKSIRINLIGTFNVARLAAATMENNEPDEDGQRGIIVNTSSIAAYDGQIGQIAYAASKGGVASMTLPMARDLAKLGIRVMAVAPGIFETPMMAGLPTEVRASLGQQVPFPSRLGKPAEFARLVVAIIENPMLNGEVIRLDGAFRMPPK